MYYIQYTHIYGDDYWTKNNSWSSNIHDVKIFTSKEEADTVATTIPKESYTYFIGKLAVMCLPKSQHI